jgi:iron complex transport system substrate-binding protein
METSPLGRAEWIRFLALFFDKQTLADSLFHETVKSYNQLKELTAHVTSRPTLLTETIYQGIWYLPGGNSYMAHIYRDAGADYLWKDDTSSGSLLALPFESVLDKAEKADFWLLKYNNPRDMTYRELAQNYPNYTFFDAFKRRNIYVCNTGKVTYYEELPIHPDYVLKDMVWIFHPELLPDYQPRYYKKMTL